MKFDPEREETKRTAAWSTILISLHASALLIVHTKILNFGASWLDLFKICQDLFLPFLLKFLTLRMCKHWIVPARKIISYTTSKQPG
jgi:hypothetical protein